MNKAIVFCGPLRYEIQAPHKSSGAGLGKILTHWGNER